jgi:hypothetical protein
MRKQHVVVSSSFSRQANQRNRQMFELILEKTARTILA